MSSYICYGSQVSDRCPLGYLFLMFFIQIYDKPIRLFSYSTIRLEYYVLALLFYNRFGTLGQLRYVYFCKYTPVFFSANFHSFLMFSLKFTNIKIFVFFIIDHKVRLYGSHRLRGLLAHLSRGLLAH